MKEFKASIPIGIGDLIYIKALFEPIKNEYSNIHLTFHAEIVNRYKRDPRYIDFINQFGALLFNESPFVLNGGIYEYRSLSQIVSDYNLTPHKPELSHILCKGESLNIDGYYIVINTKIRQLAQSFLQPYMKEFWETLAQISRKYKIVILGEKEIEMNDEYKIYSGEYIYSLYQHIYNNIPNDCLIDLTVPALGITNPDVTHIQQDCLIMNQALCVINFGIGGGFCLATAVANIICFRNDEDYVADLVFDKTYTNAVVTKKWDIFMNAIRKYL